MVVYTCTQKYESNGSNDTFYNASGNILLENKKFVQIRFILSVKYNHFSYFTDFTYIHFFV